MRSTSWTRSLAYLAIIWAVGLTILLAGAELVLRLTDDGWSRTLRLNVVRSRTYDYHVAHLYEWQAPTIRYVRDEYGLRDDCASAGDIDILTVGGSTTDQRFLAQQATFQAVMQRELTRVAGPGICVSNAGVDGHSTHGHLRAFSDWFPLIPRLRPKLFVFSIGINDADFTRTGPSVLEDKVAGRAGALKELQIAQVGLWLRETLNGLWGRRPVHAGQKEIARRSSDYTQVRLAADTAARAARNAEGFRLRLRRMLGYARANGAEAICVTQPHRQVRAVDGEKRGIRFAFDAKGPGNIYGGLDYDYSLRLLYRVMREECGQSRLIDLYNADFDDGDFYDYVHTTPNGARKIGREVARSITNSELMNQLLE